MTVNRSFSIYLFATLFSYLGDVIAVVAIPLLLFRQTKDMGLASIFSVLVLISCLATARPAAAALKKFNPITITLVSDSIAALLLLYLSFQESLITEDPIQFLGLCFLLALVINFPMFIKSQILYQYYVPKTDLQRLSMLQGKLIGLVFVAAAVIVSTFYDRIGFQKLIILDSLSYVPLLALCWRARRSLPLDGYASSLLVGNERQAIERPSIRRVILYYYFNAASYFFSNFRAHLALAFLVSIASGITLQEIGLALAFGTVTSLLIAGNFGRHVSSSLRAICFVGASTLTVGLLLATNLSYLSIALIGFLLSEINAAVLTMQRKLQTEIQVYYSREEMSQWTTITGSLLSAFLIYGVSSGSAKFGAFLPFIALSGLIFFGLALVRNESKKLVLSILFAILSTANLPLSALAGTTDYRTVMLDRPRILPQLGSNTASEDERFVMNNIHCGLFRTDIMNGTVPDLVSSWSLNDNGKVYKFKIRNDAKDSDGNTINAQYVYESLVNTIKASAKEKFWSNPTPDILGYLDIAGFRECIEGNCRLPGISVDGDTVVIRLMNRRQNFPELLSANTLPIFTLKSLANGARVPIGCGSYKVSIYSDSELKLVPNPFAKVEEGSPQSFSISFANSKLAIEKFCRGEINDLMFLVPTRKDLIDAGCDPKEYAWKETDTAGYWAINLATPRLLKDRRLHKQLADALDPNKFREDWGIESRPQLSTIPYGFEQATEPPKDRKSGRPVAHEDARQAVKPITIRYIEGTPEPKRLENAIVNWLTKLQVKYDIVPTPFTRFMQDLTLGSSDVYIYAELATAKLPNFLSPIYQMSAHHYQGKELKKLTTLWENFNAQGSQQVLLELDRMLLVSKRFVPLFIFRRPLVFRKGFYLRRHSTLGLAALPIQEFRTGYPQ